MRRTLEIMEQGIHEGVVGYDDMAVKVLRWVVDEKPKPCLVLEGGGLRMVLTPKVTTKKELEAVARELNKRMGYDLSDAIEKSVRTARNKLGDVEES